MATKLIDTDLDLQSGSRLKNLLDAVDPQEPATLSQVLAFIQSIKFKDAIVAAQGNINLSAPGATIDGIAPVSGDAVFGAILLPNQTDAKENGLYIWNGAASAMTRHPNANSSDELTNAVVEIGQGTDAGVAYRQGAVQPVIGTDNITFGTWNGTIPTASTSVAGKVELATQGEVDAGTVGVLVVTAETLNAWSGRKLKYPTTIGDGTATQFDITHNLGTRDVHVQVFEAAGSYRQRSPSVIALDTNTVRLNYTTAPSSNRDRVVVQG